GEELLAVVGRHYPLVAICGSASKAQPFQQRSYRGRVWPQFDIQKLLRAHEQMRVGIRQPWDDATTLQIDDAIGKRRIVATADPADAAVFDQDAVMIHAVMI